MGGSFADYCDVAEKTGEGRNPGATYARSAEERDTLMAPWLDRLHPDERRNNVGFRCVVRDAARVVEEALGAVAALPDAKRRQALAELARAGVWPSGENRLLPFVRDYLLSRRRRFALAPDGRRPAAEGRSIDSLRIARCDVARVDSARGAGDDLLLIGDGKLTLLDGRDGSTLFQADLKDGGAHPRHGLLLGRDGTRRVWVEGPNGWLDLVDWRSGAQTSVAELKGGRGAEPTTWCASDPEVRGDAWFVQSGESSTRVVRVAADGVHERMLSGAPPFAPARASDDGLFLPLGHALEVPLPSGWRAGPMKANLGHVSALRLDAGLATTGTTWVADGRVTLPTVPSVRRRYGGNDALRFSWFLAGSGAVCIDAPGDPWLLPTALAATYFVRDGSGNLFVWSGGKGDSLLPQPLPAPAHGDWRVVPAEGNWFEPLVISADGGELCELAQASLAPRARELDWSGDLVFGSVVRAPGRPLIVRTRAGDWFGVALDAPTRRFRRNLGRATIGEQVTQLAGGRAAISAQATPFDVWVRDVEKFDLQDEAGVVRPPIEQFTLADLGGVGRFDPVLLFADGSLVALRPADERLARLGEEWKVAAGGADAGDAH
jgi:hypothetical protein